MRIHRLRTSHAPVFLVNSRLALVSAASSSSGREVLHPTEAPLLPKLRGQFAEFLNQSSPDRLSILYLPTCVGLGYGHRINSLEVFLDSLGSLTSPKSARHQVSGLWCADLPTHRPTPLLRDNHRPVELPSCVTPSACLLPVWVARSAGLSRRTRQLRTLSIARVGMGASKRVREYQPVVHRLRLSASP